MIHNVIWCHLTDQVSLFFLMLFLSNFFDSYTDCVYFLFVIYNRYHLYTTSLFTINTAVRGFTPAAALRARALQGFLREQTMWLSAQTSERGKLPHFAWLWSGQPASAAHDSLQSQPAGLPHVHSVQGPTPDLFTFTFKFVWKTKGKESCSVRLWWVFFGRQSEIE